MYFAIYQMYKFLSKYHNVILTLIKILISVFAVYYLWRHGYLQNLWRKTQIFTSELFIILLIFSLLNWLLEIKKWQYLAGQIKKISFIEAAKQSLISFALSLLTPNRIGEYGIKVLFYDKKYYKNVLGLTLIGNVSQLLVTLCMGLSGLLYAYINGWIEKLIHLASLSGHIIKIAGLSIFGLSIIWFAYYQLKKHRQNPVFQRKLWLNANIYALLRYLIFSSQFVCLLLHFKLDYSLNTLYAGVSLVYLFSTLIPILAFLDWAVKGNVAIWIFSVLPVEGDVIFDVVALMWLGNFLLPFAVGLVWMWTSKSFMK